MSLRLILAATATLAFAAPAFAQDVPTPATAEAPARALSPEEIEMQTKSQAFEARLAQMQPELEAAVKASGGDQTKGMADVNAVLARYQPDIEGFAAALETFLDGQLAIAPDDEARQELTVAKDQVGPMLRGIPDQIRAGAPKAIAAMATAPAAPQ